MTSKIFFWNFSRLEALVKYGFVLANIKIMKSSTCSTTSRLCGTGVSASNFSMFPSGIYSLNILLAYLTISSGRFHLCSSLLEIISNRLGEYESLFLVSFSESDDCDSVLVDKEDDDDDDLFLFLDYFFLALFFPG